MRVLEDAPLVRRLDCARYAACLDVADRERWPGFTCSSCPAYAPQSPEERSQDLRGLLLLAVVLEADAQGLGPYRRAEDRA